MKNKSIVSALVVLGCFMMAGAALAAYPALPSGEPLSLNEIADIVFEVVDFIILMSGVVVTAFIIISGIRWATAGSDTTKVENAKQAFKAGIIGALVILGVGVIVNTVEVIITDRDFFFFF